MICDTTNVLSGNPGPLFNMRLKASGSATLRVDVSVKYDSSPEK